MRFLLVQGAALGQPPDVEGPDAGGYGHRLLAQETLSRFYAFPIGASRPGTLPMRIFLARAGPPWMLRRRFVSLPVHPVKGESLAFFSQWAVATHRGGSQSGAAAAPDCPASV